MKKPGPCLVAALMCLSVGQSAFAKEANERVGIGFEYGMDFQYPNNGAINGRAQSFAVFFPIFNGLSAGYYHETSDLEARQDGGKTIVDGMVQELRIRFPVWESEYQELSLLAGLGIAHYERGDDNEVDGFVGDIGAQLVVLRGQSRTVTGQIDLHVLYRHTAIDTLEIWPVGGGGVGPVGADEFTADNFSGFQIGMAIGIYL